MFFKKAAKIKGSMDLNETHIRCKEHTKECIQNNLFSSPGLLHRNMFSNLNVKNGHSHPYINHICFTGTDDE
jgi:hypothetical protein